MSSSTLAWPLLCLVVFAAEGGAETKIHMLVLLPEAKGNVVQNPFQLTALKARPVFDLAWREVKRRRLIGAPLSFNRQPFIYVDTNLSAAVGPQRVIDHYCKNQVDVIFGFAGVFALAPVARLAKFWGDEGVPILTSIGQAHTLDARDEYPTLVRLSGSYSYLSKALGQLADIHEWRRAFFLFQNNDKNEDHSECYFSLLSYFSRLRSMVKNAGEHLADYKEFNERNKTATSQRVLRSILKSASLSSNRESSFTPS